MYSRNVTVRSISVHPCLSQCTAIFPSFRRALGKSMHPHVVRTRDSRRAMISSIARRGSLADVAGDARLGVLVLVLGDAEAAGAVEADVKRKSRLSAVLCGGGLDGAGDDCPG
jgi:hypothetical protein